MKRRLILTRHAKSSWGNPGLGDHERPLNARGRDSATALGKWMGAQGYTPDQVLCSSATRTQETWARVSLGLTNPPLAEVLPTLYLAEPEEMLNVLGWSTGKMVMLIAHNPGSAWMAGSLAKAAPEDQRFEQYPTAATTVIEFTADSWTEVKWRSGEIIDFVVPRDLL